MRLPIRQPPTSELDSHLDAAREAEPRLILPNLLDQPAPPNGYRFGETRGIVGRGTDDFDTATKALKSWAFMPRWTVVHPSTSVMEDGMTLLVVARILGLWTVLPARIIEVVDETTRHGFVYAALPGHVASGIERFCIEHLADSGEVRFEVKSLARPVTPLVRAGLPAVRTVQRHFREACLNRMRECVTGAP